MLGKARFPFNFDFQEYELQLNKETWEIDNIIPQSVAEKYKQSLIQISTFFNVEWKDTETSNIESLRHSSYVQYIDTGRAFGDWLICRALGRSNWIVMFYNTKTGEESEFLTLFEFYVALKEFWRAEEENSGDITPLYEK